MRDETQTNMKLTGEEQKHWDKLVDREEEAKRLLEEAEQDMDAAVEKHDRARLMQLEVYWRMGKAIRQLTMAHGTNGKPCGVQAICHLVNLKPSTAKARVSYFELQGIAGQDEFGRRSLDELEDKWNAAQGRTKRVERRKDEAARKLNPKAYEETKLIDDILHRSGVCDQIRDDRAVRKLNALIETSERGEGAEAEQATAQIEKTADKYETDVETLIDVVQDMHKMDEHSKKLTKVRQQFPMEARAMHKKLAEKYDHMNKEAFIEFVMQYINVAIDPSRG